MDFSLIIFFGIVIYFAFSGYKSGFFSVLSRVISIPLAYIIAIVFAQDFGRWLQDFSPVGGLFSYLVGGAILFVATIGIMSLIFGVIKKLVLSPDYKDSPASAITGGILGAAVGVFIGVLTVWFSSTVTDLLKANLGNMPDEHSGFTKVVNKATSNVIESISNRMSDADAISKVTTSLMTNPAEQVQRFNQLANRGYFQEIFYSNTSRQALDTLDAAKLWATPAFQNLAKDEDFIALANTLDLNDGNLSLDKQMAVKVTEMWAQIDSVKTDPRFIEITQDPEVVDMMNRRDVFKMLNSAKIEQLLSVITSVETPDITFNPQKAVEEKKVEVYRWVDEKGRVHYSDKKQKDEASDNN